MSDHMYSIEIASDAAAYFASLPASVLTKVIHSVDLLATTPFLGRKYAPEYESASAPVPCRMLSVPGTTAQFFYTVDEDKECVVVVWAGDARMDPRSRFAPREP